MGSEQKFRDELQRQARDRALKRLEQIQAAGDGWVAVFDPYLASFLHDNRVGGEQSRKFSWKGFEWIVERIAPAPCGCDARLVFVRKVGATLDQWRGVRCPAGVHVETYTVELST